MLPEMNVKVVRTKDAIYSCALTFCSAHFLCALAYGPHAKNMALLATTTILYLPTTLLNMYHYPFCFFFASECLCYTELNKWISFSFPVVVQLWNPTKQYLAEICTLPTFQWVQMQNKKYMFSFPEVYTVIIWNWPLKIGFNFNEIPYVP